MNVSEIKVRLTDEINCIPQERLVELYHLIHFYRLGLETLRNNTEDIITFAGCWKDMPDQAFEDFLNDITERRQRAFSARRAYETFSD